MKEHEWPAVLPIVQSVLENTVRASLGNRAPITVFSGLPADNPLRLIILPTTAKTKLLNEVRALRLMNTTSLQESLDQIHTDVAERRSKKRKAAIKIHNSKTNVPEINFSVGDFVLVAKRVRKDGHKLQVQCLGPQRVIRVESDWVFEVQDLMNGRTSLVHANRLKFYADSKLNVTDELLESINHNDTQYSVVTKILGLRYNKSNN